MGERYIKLNGNSVEKGPLYNTLQQSDGPKLTGLLFAFNSAAIIAFNPMSMGQNLAYIGLSLVFYAASETLMQGLELVTVKDKFKQKDKGKCIDRAPDSGTLPTDPEDFAAAKSARNELVYYLAGALGGGVLSHLIFNPELILEKLTEKTIKLFTEPNDLTFVAVAGCTAIARGSQIIYRFHKVVTGHHHILKEPPKEKAKEPDIAPNLAPAPSVA